MMTRALALALMLAACGGGGGGSAPKPQQPPRPTQQPPPRVTVAPGVTMDPGATDRDLDLLRVTGIRYVRVPAWRDWWYPVAGQTVSPQQRTLDSFVDRATARGFQVTVNTAAVATVCTWDKTDDCAADLGRWHAELARRYPAIEALEVLNESTAHPPWDRSPGHDYEKGLRIARVLCAVRDSVRAADPGMTVVPGSGGSATEYLRGLKDGGAYPCLDAFVIHGYEPVAPALARVRQYTTLPVWVTEFGAEAVSDAHHLQVWRDAYQGSRGVARLYGFAWRHGYWGVLREDGSPRPTYGWLVQEFGQ